MDTTTILRKQDRASFDWLYNRYAGMLLVIIRKMVEENTIAERLLLETFVAIWKSPDEFDGTACSLFTWMLRTARAKAAEYNRHNDQEDQQGEAYKKGGWTPSFHQRPTGQKQYSNW